MNFAQLRSKHHSLLFHEKKPADRSARRHSDVYKDAHAPHDSCEVAHELMLIGAHPAKQAPPRTHAFNSNVLTT
jgi:hypothetical protein